MKKIFYIFIITLFNINAFSQEMKYFNVGFKTHINQKSDYIRLYTYNNDIIQVQDFINDTLYRKGRFIGFSETKLLDEFISENSKSQRIRKPRDEFKAKKAYVQYFKRDGTLTSQQLFYENERKYIQIYYEGVGILENGTGEYTEKTKNTENYRKYRDSVKVEGYQVRLDKKDTIYHFDIVKDGMPKKGMDQFYKEIFKKLNKASFLRDIDKERIRISFIIDEQGNLTEFSTRDIQNADVKEQMFKRLEKLNSWNPAKFNGKNVKIRISLPINIKQPNDNFILKLY